MLLEYLLDRTGSADSPERERLGDAVFEVDSPHPSETADTDGITSALRAVDPPVVSDNALVQAVHRSVDAAMYWQPPDGLDQLCALPTIREALRETAEHWVATQFTEWWGGGFSPDNQVWLRFLGRPAPGGVVHSGRSRHKLAPTSQQLTRWREATDAAEETARLRRDPDVRARFSGDWWSAPMFLADATCRRLAEAGATGLWWVEDGFGPDYAELFSVRVDPAIRVFDIRGADDWAELCQEYPLEVTWSRRHDWYRVTGRDGRWVIPDWSRVAEDYDGVHLTVLGYLNAAGRAIDVSRELGTVLSGWNPGETYWLNNRAWVLNEHECWEGGGEWRRPRWRRVDEGREV